MILSVCFSEIYQTQDKVQLQITYKVVGQGFLLSKIIRNSTNWFSLNQSILIRSVLHLMQEKNVMLNQLAPARLVWTSHGSCFSVTCTQSPGLSLTPDEN